MLERVAKQMTTIEEVVIIEESPAELARIDALAPPVAAPEVKPKPAPGQKVFSPSLRTLLKSQQVQLAA